MLLRILVLCVAFVILGGSFINNYKETPSHIVKKNYYAAANKLILEAEIFYNLLERKDSRQLQHQFLKCRSSYKEIEFIVEYFFPFYASKLNGPPIPFFEEADPDKEAQSPSGFQLIESFIYPKINIEATNELKIHTAETIRYIKEMIEVQESFAFNDENIFDAMMEQLFRVTALGLSGFDSQAAMNSLAECNSVLKSIQQVIRIYEPRNKELFSSKYHSLDSLLKHAQNYIITHQDFNSFNRMYFIKNYLNPITRQVGEYKIQNNYKDNESSLYYSSIRKTNTLFDSIAFRPDVFLGDYTMSPEKIELGRRLFFEPQLSSNGKRSCATCHQPEKAFTDGQRKSMALDGHTLLKRNAPTILNAALQKNLFYDSRSINLEEQVMQVLNNVNEMHNSASVTAENILKNPEYIDLYNAAFPVHKSANPANDLANAIASYERTLIALNSKFDRHMRGDSLLSKNEINGFNVFMGKAKCGTCHFIPLFSGAKPPRYYHIESEVLGVPLEKNKRKASIDNDSGRFLITGIPIHLFSFKTPSIRNIELTAPYMHNGVFDTLEEVVDFYNNGGGKGLKIAPENQTLPFEKLKLTSKEKRDIILFMKTLTDTTIVY
jgi:cytochrome c peroxidase